MVGCSVTSPLHLLPVDRTYLCTQRSSQHTSVPEETHYHSNLIVTSQRGLGSTGRVRPLAADMHHGQRLISEGHQHRSTPTQAISDVPITELRTCTLQQPGAWVVECGCSWRLPSWPENPIRRVGRLNVCQMLCYVAWFACTGLGTIHTPSLISADVIRYIFKGR